MGPYGSILQNTGNICVIDMMNKKLFKVYAESDNVNGTLAFNTNDTMILSGNQRGEIIIRNLLHQYGSPMGEDQS